MASLRCHGDSDCNKIQIIRNFHLYIIQLWQPFPHIFTHANVVNAQANLGGIPTKISTRATLKLTGIHRIELVVNSGFKISLRTIAMNDLFLIFTCRSFQMMRIKLQTCF